MTHTDTDIAEILERFRKEFVRGASYQVDYGTGTEWDAWVEADIEELEGFIYSECLALKKKWEREHFDNKD